MSRNLTLSTTLKTLIVLRIFSGPAYAYAIEADWEIPIGKQVMGAFSASAVYMSLGGPNVRCRLGEEVVLHLGMIPSLKFGMTGLYPKIGTGLWTSYQRLIVGVPVYYEKTGWVPTLALGTTF